MEISSLRKVRTFVAVARSGSFSAAGRKLSISQPAVSKQMQELETEVGVKLFERGRPLALSEVGRTMLQYAERLLLSADQLEGVLESRTTLRGHLEIGASTVWEYLLPRLAAEFRLRHAEVTVGLRIGNSEQIARFVAQREVRLGFVGALPGTPELEAVPAGEDELVLIAPLGHPLAKLLRVHPAALLGQAFVQRERDSATAQIAERYLRQLGIEPAPVMELGSNEAVKVAVRSGAGIAFLSKHAVAEDLRTRTLIRVALEGPPCTRPLYALRTIGRPPTPLEAAFLQEVLAGAAATPRPRNSSPAPRGQGSRRQQ